MYKKASDKQNFLKKTGSHSMTGTRRSRHLAVPPHVQDMEEVYVDLDTQYRLLTKAICDVQDELGAIKRQLQASGKLSPGQIHDLTNRREDLRDRLGGMMGNQGDMKRLLREAGELPYAIVFYEMARYLLSMDLFIQIDEATRKLMTRGPYESRLG